MNETGPGIRWREALFLAAFVLLNLALSCYWLDVWLTPNATSRALPVLTLHEQRTLAIDRYASYTGDKSLVRGHYYSDKAPLATFAVVPLYELWVRLRLPGLPAAALSRYPIYVWGPVGLADGRSFLLPAAVLPLAIGGVLCASLPFVLALTIAFLLRRRRGGSIHDVWVVMLAFYSSYLFVYAGTFTGHLLAALLVLGAWLLLRGGRRLAAGLLVGLGLLTEYPVAILAPAWALVIALRERRVRPVATFLAGVVPAALLQMVYDAGLTGSPWRTPYTYAAHEAYRGVTNLGFGLPRLEALWGLTFGSYRGAFFHAPLLLVLLAYALVRSARRPGAAKRKREAASRRTWVESWLAIPIGAYLLLVASHSMWWGGWAYGPRHLIPPTVVLLVAGLEAVRGGRSFRAAYLAAGAAGLALAWIAKSTRVYMLPDNPGLYGNPVFGLLVPDLAAGRLNANSLPTMIAGVPPALANPAWLALFCAGTLALTGWHAALLATRTAGARRDRAGRPRASRVDPAA